MSFITIFNLTNCVSDLVYDYRFESGQWSALREFNVQNGYSVAAGGYAVAVYETTALISAYNAIVNDVQTGIVHVYSLDNDEWIFVSSLTGEDLAEGDQFGSYLSMYGDTAVISNSASEGNTGKEIRFLCQRFDPVCRSCVLIRAYFKSVDGSKQTHCQQWQSGRYVWVGNWHLSVHLVRDHILDQSKCVQVFVGVCAYCCSFLQLVADFCTDSSANLLFVRN